MCFKSSELLLSFCLKILGENVHGATWTQGCIKVNSVGQVLDNKIHRKEEEKHNRVNTHTHTHEGVKVTAQ